MKIIEGQKYYTIFEVAETVGVHQSQQELLYQCRRCKKIGIGRTDRAERQRAC